MEGLKERKYQRTDVKIVGAVDGENSSTSIIRVFTTDETVSDYRTIAQLKSDVSREKLFAWGIAAVEGAGYAAAILIALQGDKQTGYLVLIGTIMLLRERGNHRMRLYRSKEETLKTYVREEVIKSNGSKTRAI